MNWPETRNSLIRRLADPADAIAWAEFERVYQPAIYRYVRSRGLQPQDALDAVQEVLIIVHRQAANWAPSGRVGSFRAWLGETARRVTLQQLRLRDKLHPASAGGMLQLDECGAHLGGYGCLRQYCGGKSNHYVCGQHPSRI